MKKIIISAISTFLLIGAISVSPPDKAEAQSWQDINIDYKDSKDRGKFTARYKTEKQAGAKNGCRTTVELTNKTDKTISGYYVKFTFKEGDNHERRHTSHFAGRAESWRYENCGVNSVQVYDVK